MSDTPRRRLFVRDLVSVGSVDEGDDPEANITLWKRMFSREQRDTLAAKGQALPDGSFPIVSVQDLRNAVSAIGRAKNPDAARRHIIKRARALGRTDLLPDAWSVSKMTDTNADSGDETKGNGMVDLSGLDEEVRAPIEKAIEDYEARIAELQEDDGTDPVLKGLPDEAIERFEKLESDLAKERDDRLLVEWVGKAREFERTLGDAEKAAPHLKALPVETADWLLEKLKTVETVLEASDLFKNLGSSDEGSAKEKIEALAKEKQTENPDLTPAQARSLVRDQHPELVEAERAEV